MVIITLPGPLTTVQDGGRNGYMSTGFSPCGAMDRLAMEMANAILGNDPGEGVLEATLSGPKLYFEESCCCAVADAAGVRSFNVPAGCEVDFGRITGLRRYIAVKGGFDIKPYLGSVSTDMKCGVGGFGRKLAAGDRLALRRPEMGRELVCARPSLPENILAVPGPQDGMFSKQVMRDFFSREFGVSAKSDRMGIRLEGEPLSPGKTDIISDGIVMGSVQLPSSGLPIVLMADRQTTGGYAKIATVITACLPRLAQMGPGERFKFEKCGEKRAVDLLKRQKDFIGKLKKAAGE